MPRRSRQLVVEYLENVSRRALEKRARLIGEYVKGKTGVYALYRGDRLKYVGLATDLRNRLKNHLIDRHAQSWDKFSVYLTVDDEHIRELEALVIRIATPKENLTRTKFRKAENLRSRFRKDIATYQKRELNELFGIHVEEFAETRALRRPAKKLRAQKGNGSKIPTLSPYVDSRKPFFKIYATYKGKKYEAIVLGNGIIKYEGRIYYSPSGAGREVRKGKETAGWVFWKYRDPKTREWVPLDNIRRK